MQELRIWNQRRIREFQARLLVWYNRHQRALPWRRYPSPYRVWISEIMLQQTQVKTVLPYYENFLSRFPDVNSLAAAPEEEVLAQWAGLGYYSRARNLHRTANQIVREFNGRFPSTMEEIRRLPGIGRYTAGAILSIAFNHAQPVVDGNVRRIITRLHGIASQAPDSFFWKQAAAWVDAVRPSDFNQAVMELGALVCTPSVPRCATCPVSSLCAAFSQGVQNRIPARRPNRATEEVALVILVIRRGDAVLLSRKPPTSFIPGPWGLPARLLQPGESPETAVRTLSRSLNLKKSSLRKVFTVRHCITHRRIAAQIFEAQSPTAVIVREKEALRWIESAHIDRYLTSSLYRKALK